MARTPRSRSARFWVTAMISLALAISVISTGTATAVGARISLKPAVGPPTSKVKVIGKRFGQTEQVDILFDTKQVGVASTDPSGAFIARIKVPEKATPGSHTVTAT